MSTAGCEVRGSGLYRTARNTPHFALPRGTDHRPDCGPPTPLRSQAPRTIPGETTGDARVGDPVPSVLEPPREGPPRHALDDGRTPRPRYGSGSSNATTRRRTTVSLLRSIAVAHRTREDVAAHPLTIPGHAPSTYDDLIVRWTGAREQDGQERIYFAPLLFRPTFRRQPAERDWVIRVGATSAPLRVLVEHGDWRDRTQLAALSAEVDAVRDEAQRIWDGMSAWERRRRRFPRAWLYVLGTPDVIRRRLVVGVHWGVAAVLG